MPINSTIIIPGADLKYRNADSSYNFRQDSSFYYLSGFCEADSTMLIVNTNGVITSSVFVPRKDKLKEIKSKGAQKKLMGIKIDIKEISLTGSKNIYDENNNIIGELRSACYSPHFQMVIGIAMIQKSYWEVSQTFKIQINDSTFRGKVCDLPFI